MLIPKKNRREVYKYLFKEGVLEATKDFNLPRHSEELDVPNLQVIKLMQSFTSLEYVTERFAWRHYYWPLERAAPGARPPRREGFGGGGGFGGDREGYRREGGGFGRGAPADKAGAPGAYQPQFGGGFGRGAPPK
ncbi:Plectin/S10 domain-containing protein [Dunaliella salina]|uniref:Plectin/S10 domain-containing protein n=1 Tax=Dunaliella salina TaxID=3046 RepID=A0ABQ7H380_DUNSA|nr:Plectin/S10 domain-containing protein [Dunaliella salina]|eukprot:KAF5841328.1 Plectin/S10 domain-containing protein [Dunaliella salina]